MLFIFCCRIVFILILDVFVIKVKGVFFRGWNNVIVFCRLCLYCLKVKFVFFDYMIFVLFFFLVLCKYLFNID